MQFTQQVKFWQRFRQMPLVGICRNLALSDLLHILPIYKAAGLQNIEITMNTPGAAGIIKTLVKEFGSAINIGAGTVCSEGDLDLALIAGATFIVTPIVNEKVIRGCRSAETPVFAGAFTPTEIFKAWSYGADVVKLFPSSAISMGFFRDLRGPFPQIPLLPTGGVNLDNCVEFIGYGAAGVGIGSNLFPKAMLATGNRVALQKHFEAYAARITVAMASGSATVAGLRPAYSNHALTSTDHK